jgi:predicted pyridoxine 5'-phosphate oxidase superfamily flavin-nucleotide-binding protein
MENIGSLYALLDVIFDRDTANFCRFNILKENRLNRVSNRKDINFRNVFLYLITGSKK